MNFGELGSSGYRADARAHYWDRARNGSNGSRRRFGKRGQPAMDRMGSGGLGLGSTRGSSPLADDSDRSSSKFPIFPIFPTTHPSLSLRLAVEWVRPRIQVVVCLPLDPPQAQMAILAPHLPAPQTKFFLICALPVLKFNISLYVCVYGDTGASWRREYEPRREGFLFLASWALVRSSPRRSKHSGSATGRYRK